MNPPAVNIVPGDMTITPWGPSEMLRERRLRPGPGASPDEVAANQRERLFGAMVASVAQRGYGATRLSDLTELSGVSSKSFYALFTDKEACLLATVDALLEHFAAADTVTDLMKALVEQPAAARLLLIEAQAGGADVRARLQRATLELERQALARVARSPDGPRLPAEMVAAGVGGMLEVARNRLVRGEEDELPRLGGELVDWLTSSYPPPPEPLRMTSRWAPQGSETLDAHDHADRILRAMTIVVAERGYASTTIDDIVRRAGVSASMFYAHFPSKEDALAAAIESGGAQIVAVLVPAFRRNSHSPHAVRAGLGAFFNLLASRPSLARLMLVEVYAAGPEALARREEALQPLGVLWADARRRRPATPSVVFEAILGGILHLARERLEGEGAAALPGLAPLATYLALTPFTGPEQAVAAANEDGRTPLSRVSDSEAVRAAAMRPITQETLRILGRAEATAGMIARDLGLSEPVVVDHLEALGRIGLVRLTQEGETPAENRYRSDLREIHTEEWAHLSLAEREEITGQIRTLVDADLDLAISSGTFDQRPERVLVRAALTLDERGWNEMSGLQTETLAKTMEIEAKSRARLAKGAEGIEARTALMLFEVPKSGEEGAAPEG